MVRYSKRVCVLYCTFVFIISLLSIRLYVLLSADENKAMSVLDGQYTGRIDVAEHTGFVYDRNMSLLSHKKTTALMLINPAVCKDYMETADSAADFAAVSLVSDIYSKLKEGVPFTVSVEETKQEAAKKLCSEREEMYYVDVYSENFDTAVHFLGYRNSQGEGIGGVRGYYNTRLTENMKAELSASFETNAKRMSLSSFDIDIDSYNRGDGIITTIDADIQRFCDGLQGEIESGAVVVSDIESGEILALASYPSFDGKKVAEVLESDKGELLNRVNLSFTPGSVFKIVVALAALEKDMSLYELKYTCEGSIQVGEDVFKCHNKSGHGEITLEDAFKDSCNTYFVNLAKTIGLESIVNTAKKLELDVPTKADFLKESENFFIDEENKRAGYLANISFGQGDLCLSPLDMTRIVIAATSGKLCELSVIRGEIIGGFPNKWEEKQSKKVFSQKVCEKMLSMMEKCVNEGTGVAAAVEGARVGGKTATAQTGRKNAQEEEIVNKWFCGVYPIENPKICVCVLYDGVCENSPSPGVVFSKIIERMREKGY